MRKEAIFSDRAGRPGGHYSQAIIFQNLVFTAGVVGTNPNTGQIAKGGIEAQVRQALDNIKIILQEANTTIDNILKVNAYLRDIGNFELYNQVYKEYFNSQPLPARTTVEVGFAGEIEFEIDVIAFIPDN